MKLIDCVESLSTHTLQKILKHHPPYTIQMEEGSTLSFLLNTDYLCKLWEEMKPSEHYMVITLLAHIDEPYLAYHKISAIVGIPIGECMVGLTHLRQKGLVFTHRRFFGEIGYFIPEDVREELLRLLIRMQHPDYHDFRSDTFYVSKFYEGLWSVLHYVRCNPLPLTQKGFIHKRYISVVEEQIKFLQPTAEKLLLEYEGNNYSKGLALILDFATTHDLLGEKEELLLISSGTALDWVHHTEEQRMDLLWHYMRHKITTFYPLEIRLLIEWLYLLPIGKQVKWDYFIYFLQRLRFDASVYSNILTIDLLQIMQVFGMVVLIEVHGEWWIGRPLLNEHVVTNAYISSNLQMMVPAMMPISIRWQIGEFAEPLLYDQMITYEITKNSMERAVELGWTEEKVLSFLQSITPNIPDNVIHMIHQWMEDCTKLRFMDILVLECKDEKLLIELKSQPLFADYIYQELSTRHLIIQRNKLAEFRHALIQAGYTPMKKLISYDDGAAVTLHPASPLLRSSLYSDPKVENVYPEWEDTFPGIRTIPKTWVDTYRTYHPSSLVDLLKRAEQHHLKLSLKLKNLKIVERISLLSMQQIGGDVMLRIRTSDLDRDQQEEWISVKEILEVAVHLPY